MQIEIKTNGECQPAAGSLTYPISGSQMIQIPYVAEACKAVSAKVTLPQGEKGGGLQPTKLHGRQSYAILGLRSPVPWR